MRNILGLLRWKYDLFKVRLHEYTVLSKEVSVNGLSVTLSVNSRRELSRCASYLTKEPRTLAWIDSYFCNNDILFDVGANIGQYSLYAALRYHKVRVFCFEPESQNLAALNRNIFSNGLSQRVYAYGLALNEEVQVGELNIHSQLCAGGAIHQFGIAIDDEGHEFVPVHKQGVLGISLDEFVYRLGMPCPNCLKIDVDGLEDSVVRGASKLLHDPQLRNVLIEITDIDDNAHGTSKAHFIYRVLEEAGFVEAERTPARVNHPEYPSSNVIFIRNNSG